MKKVLASVVTTVFAGVATMSLVPSISHAQDIPKEGKITPLFGNPLSDIKGREGVMLTVEYPPGGSSPIHRHDAHVYVYVLEGSIVMKAKGKPEVTLGPGQTFYESPNDVHEVGKNASDSKPAKFLVFMVKKKGVPPVLPAK